MKKLKQTRISIIDEDGLRVYERYNMEISQDIQDEGKTLKIFLRRRLK